MIEAAAIFSLLYVCFCLGCCAYNTVCFCRPLHARDSRASQAGMTSRILRACVRLQQSLETDELLTDSLSLSLSPSFSSLKFSSSTGSTRFRSNFIQLASRPQHSACSCVYLSVCMNVCVSVFVHKERAVSAAAVVSRTAFKA